MAKQVIVLEQIPSAGIAFRYALWASVPVARQPFYADASKKSHYKDATAAEISALQAGQVVERVDSQAWPAGTTAAAIKAALQTAWSAFQNEISGKNDWSQYGTFWDGAAWTNQGAV